MAEFKFTDEPEDDEFQFTDEPVDYEFTDAPVDTVDDKGFKQAGKRIGQSISKGVGDTLYGVGLDPPKAPTLEKANYLKLFPKGFMQNVESTGKDPADITEAEFQEKVNLELDANGKPRTDFVRDAATKLREFGESDAFTQEVDPDKGFDKGLFGFLEDVGTGFSEFGGSMALTAVNPAAGTMAIYNQMYGGKKKDLLKQGIDPERADRAATIHAMLGTPAELAGNLLGLGIFKKLAKGFGSKIPISKRFQQYIGGIMLGGAGEGSEEGIKPIRN